MAIFYVFQGETYDIGKNGKYVWSPQKGSDGRENAGFKMMTNIHENDFILHSNGGKLVAISIATEDCREEPKPNELFSRWGKNGYMVRTTEYSELSVPLKTIDHQKWLKDNYIEGSAFTRAGKGKQQYMCRLAEQHAIFLLKEAIELQKKNKAPNKKELEALNLLKNALSEIVDDKESEYDQVEIESINELVDNTTYNTKPVWGGIKEKQATTNSPKTNRVISKRDPQRAADALARAGYECEYDRGHKTFLRKNTPHGYTEPHHLIPISKYHDFDYSVDVMENIVSLCSHCHNLLHYGRFEDKKPILEKLYKGRIAALKKCGLDLTIEELEEYYK